MKEIFQVETATHYYNINDVKTKKESTVVLRSMKHRELPVLVQSKQPTIIFLSSGELTELKDLRHSEDTVKDLNTKGLHVYLFEPLSSYLINYNQYNPPRQKYSMIFYSEFNSNEDLNDLRAPELDSILNYAKNNNLNNIIVHTCDYDVQKYYPYYNNIRLITDDFILKNLFIRTYLTSKFDKKPSNNFSKKFLNFNWRHTFHRHYIAAYLADKSCYLSWYFRSPLENITKLVFMDLDSWQETNPKLYETLKQGIDSLNKKVPLNVDLEVNDAVDINYPYYGISYPAGNNILAVVRHNIKYIKEKIKKVYKDIFVEIVSETRFAQFTANYSEKTIQPIIHMRPFILVAPPFTLKYLQEEGYKTFSDFWDESYDVETNHEKRLVKILNLIDSIDQKSIEELQELYIKMVDILTYNFNLLESKSKLFTNELYWNKLRLS